jgi:hypothetical protein
LTPSERVGRSAAGGTRRAIRSAGGSSASSIGISGLPKTCAQPRYPTASVGVLRSGYAWRRSRRCSWSAAR